ncbi:hypothetical protein BJX64DRAFT_284979 [Aspergillus heterothallicus]
MEGTEGLEYLIDRPLTRDGQHLRETNHHHYEQYSKRIALWIASNLSDNVIRMMEADPERPLFADDYIAKLERVVFRFAYNNPWLVYDDVLAIDTRGGGVYGSIEQFVEAL